MTRRLQRFLALVLLASPTTLFALGLGDIQLHSALNEPLDADIELVSAAPDELSSLKASLANRETFARYGLDRPASLLNLEFRVTRSGDGRNVLKVRSREPITEPFVSFLVEVNWSRGRLLREYTLLMDPPIYMPGTEQVASAPVSAPQAGATETERSGQVQRPVEAPPRAAEPAAVSRPSAPEQQAPPATIDGSNYTVRNNDTLWQIASSLKPGAASGINRMMMALYRANPDAFAGNINQLRAGAILRIPADAEYDAIQSGEANAEVRRQYAQWRESRGIAGAGETPAEARLRLVTPTEGGEGTAAAGTAATAEAQQLRDRVRALETQLDDSRRMIEVKDQELATLQRQLGQPTAQPPAEPATTTAPPPAEQPAPTEPQAVTPDSTAPEATQVPAEEPAPTPAVEPETAPPAAAQPAPAEATPEKASWIDWLLANWYYAGAALLVLGLILFALTRRRQEPDFGNFGKLADAARSSGGGGGGAVAREREPRIEREPVTTPLRAKVVDEAFLVEESGEHVQPKFKPAAPEPVRAEKAPARGKSADDTLSSETAINLDQGDPLAEADFHMAYGLYDQAADLVKIAIEREPQRRDLKLKLLEIYFVWGNKDSFLQAARELAETRGQAAPGEWDKIAIMGRQISPDDPLFAPGAAPHAGAADVDLNLEGGENRVDLDLLGAPEGEHAGAIDLDLGHEDTATTGESPALREGEVGLDFVMETPGRGSDGSATTREMAARTMETPTIETEYHGGRDSPTIESPSIRQRESTTIREKLSAAMRQSVSPDQTAELALDDLGLEIDQLPDAEQSALEETDHPSDAATMLAGLDDQSRRALQEVEGRTRSSRDEPTMRSATLTGEENISPTGTWVLDDKTLAATMALPGAADRAESTTTRTRALAAAGDGAADTSRRRKVDAESTAELAGLSAEEMDLDLDRLEAALQSDTIKHPRKGSTAEHKFSDDVFGTDTATDLDLDVGEVKRDRDREPTSTARIPADEMGLPELEPVTMSEVGTKLDLARAYMDMGDPEGARSILDEVLTEGSASQKQEAQRLIDSLPG
jgi:pilus assembly protein FimV